MTPDNEQWYDAEVAPVLLQLATRCAERGMSLVADVEYEPDKRASTYSLTEGAGLAMHMAHLCSRSGENVDGYIISLVRHCARTGVKTDASIVLSRFGGAFGGAK